MTYKFMVLILLCFSPLLVLGVHIVFSRAAQVVFKDLPPQAVCVTSVLAANIPMLAVLFSILSGSEDRAGFVVYSLLVFNSIGYTYFHIFNMSETARRIRILYELERTGGLRAEAITSLYALDEMVDVRISRLISLKQIEETKGGYVLKGRLLYNVARVVDFWGRLLGMGLVSRK